MATRSVSTPRALEFKADLNRTIESIACAHACFTADESKLYNIVLAVFNEASVCFHNNPHNYRHCLMST